MSLELVLQAPEKYLVPPFMLQVQWWHIGSFELAIVGIFIPQKSRNAIHRDFFLSDNSFLNTFQHTTTWSPKISPVSRVCVCLAALELRLKAGAHRCEGRVEVKHWGAWGTVYVQYWFLEDANTLCRHLECGVAIDAPRGSYFGPRLGTIWYFCLPCNRTEPESTLSINNCVQSDFKNNTHILSHDQDIGVVCSGKSCLVWEGISSRKDLSFIPRMIMGKSYHRL